MIRNDTNQDKLLCFGSSHLGLPNIYVRGHLSLSYKNAINKFCVNLCSSDSGICKTFFHSFFLSFFLSCFLSEYVSGLSFFPLHYFYMEKDNGVSAK